MKNTAFPNQIKNVLSLTLFSLILTSPIASPAETLILQMSEQSRQALKSKAVTKIFDGLAIDGDKSLPVEVKTRGQSSMGFDRKNYLVSLTDEVKHEAHLKIDGIKSDKIILSAGTVDPLLIKNRIAHRLFSEVKVPALETGLTELIINGESQGLYMVTKSPDEVLLKEHNVEIVLRRRYNDVIEVKKAKHSVDDVEAIFYQDALQSLHREARKLKGDALVSFLESKIDLDTYFRFLAVNYLIKNGDYSDEVFFGGYRTESGDIKFKVMPWDLDDSFAERMHGGSVPFHFNTDREDTARRQLVYNFESRLDRALVGNGQLMERYFKVASQVASELSPEKIDEIVDSVAKDLSKYLSRPSVLSAGLSDEGKKTYTVAGVEQALADKRKFLKDSLSEMQTELALARSESDVRTAKFRKLEEKLGGLIQKIYFYFSKKDK